MEIELSPPYRSMLKELRERGASNPDSDIQQLVEDAIHNGYQQMESEQS